jgi:O-glycosyl hydrolase
MRHSKIDHITMNTLIDYYLSTRFKGYCLQRMTPLEFASDPPKRRSTIHISVDEIKTCQDVLGIGYSFEHTSCYNFMKLPLEKRRAVLELLVDPAKGAGMNLWRLCIGTPDFTYAFYSYDDMPAGEADPELKRFSIEKDMEFIIPVAKLAKELNPSILFFSSPWSPPGWMKLPEAKFRKGKVEIEGGKGMCSGRLNPAYYDAYAEYLVRYLQAYKAEGIDIHAITVQNEPWHNWYLMPTCYWDPENERDLIKNHLGPKLEKNGLKTEIWCWDHNWGTFAPAKYPQVVLRDPDAAKFVSGIGFHHYSNVHVSNMGKFHGMFPDKPVYFTEGSLFWLWGASRLISYFKNWSRSYSGWVPFIDTAGNPNIGPFKAKRTLLQPVVPGIEVAIDDPISEEHAFPVPGILARFEYYIISHFSKFIQRGAVRVASTNRTPQLTSEVSFKNPDGTVVAVIVNRRHHPISARLSWHGQHATADMPRQSIATLRWQGT